MFRICCLTMISLLPLSSFAADSADDLKALAGTWTPMKAELAGAEMPEDFRKSVTLKITGSSYDATVGQLAEHGSFTIDVAAKPKEMKITVADGPNKGKVYHCIYEFTGDTLRVCYDLSGEKAPTDFATAAGTKLYLVTYARKKE